MVTEEQIHAGRILIVDGTHTGMEFIEAALHAGGYTDITLSDDADEACKMHEQLNFDMIMLNLEVADLNSFQVIKAARELKNGESLPTMVFSNDNAQRRRALEMDVRDFVQMPFIIDEVLLQVSTTIKMRLLAKDKLDRAFKLELLLKEVNDSRDLILVLNTALQVKDKENISEHEELESYSHSVSHDLRSPLRFVNGIAHKLLSNPAVLQSDTAVGQVEMIVQTTEEMGHLINRLLIFSQASREPLQIHRVYLQKLFQKIVKEQQNGHEIEIVVEEMAPCMGDKTLLKEVVSNLLQNAIKYTRTTKGGKITIGCTEKEGEHVYFVKDNGVGFDMKHYDLLFVPFKRLHNNEEFKGTGIGLALVKRIIERHGGRIWAEGIVGKGATFYFTLGKNGDLNGSEQE